MKTYCLLNHTLTEAQLAELKQRYHSTQVVYPPEEISAAWSQLPPGLTYDTNVIKAVLYWLKDAEPGDTVVIQGEAGSTFILVDYLLSHDLIPLHAVSRRVSADEHVGEMVKKSLIFKHVCFRPYCRLNDL